MDDLFSLPEQNGLPAKANLLTRLTTALTQGDLIAALRLVNGQPAKRVASVMWQAGFDVPSPRDPRFWHVVQCDIYAAIRAKTDGWGLKDKN